MSTRPAWTLAALLCACSALCGETGVRELAVENLRLVARWGDGRLRHSDRLTSLTLLAGGKRVLSSAQDATARIWDIESGQELKRFSSPQCYVWSTALLPDEKQVLVADDKMVSLFDIDTGQKIRSFEASKKESVYRLCLTPDAKRFVCCLDGGGVQLWEIATGQVLRLFAGHTKDVYTVAIPPDGKTLATGSTDDTVRIWDLESGQCRQTLAHDGTVYTVAFCPNDAQKLATCCEKKKIRLWNLQDGKELWSTTLGDSAMIVAFTPDGKMLAAGAGKSILLLSAADGKEVRKIETPEGAHWPMLFTPDGKELLSGKELVVRWDVQTGKRLFPPPETALAGNRAGALALGAQHLFSAGETGKIHAWDLRTGQETQVYDAPERVCVLALSPDGSRLLAGGNASKLWLWDLASGTRLHEIATGRTVYHAEFLAGGRRLVTNDQQNAMAVWNLEAGDKIATLQGHTKDIDDIAVSPDGFVIASVSSDGSLRYWGTSDAKELKSVVIVDKEQEKESDKDARHCVFFPDGRSLLTLSRGNVLRLWRAAVPKVSSAADAEKRVAELSSDDFETRVNAVAALIPMGETVLPLLDKLNVKVDPELAMRVQQVRSAIARERMPADSCAELKIEPAVQRLAVHPDGKHWLALAGVGANMELIIGEAGEKSLKIVRRIADGCGAQALVIAPDGQTFYLGNRDSTISVYSTRGAE